MIQVSLLEHCEEVTEVASLVKGSSSAHVSAFANTGVGFASSSATASAGGAFTSANTAFAAIARVNQLLSASFAAAGGFAFGWSSSGVSVDRDFAVSVDITRF